MAAATISVLTSIKNSYIQRVGVGSFTSSFDNSGVQAVSPEIDVSDAVRIGVRLAPTTNNFGAFQIRGKFNHTDASYTILKSTAAHFTTPSGILVDASGDLTALAAASVGWFFMDAAGLVKLQLWSNAAAGTCNLTCTYNYL